MRAPDETRAATSAAVQRIQDLPSLQTNPGGEASHVIAGRETPDESNASREREEGGANYMQSFDHGPGDGRVIIGAPAAAKTSGGPQSPNRQLRGTLRDAARSTRPEGRLAPAGPERVSFDPSQGASTAWRPLGNEAASGPFTSHLSFGERFDDARTRAERSLDAAAEATMGACHAAYRATLGALPATLRRLSLLASAMFAVYVLSALAHPNEALAQAGPASGEGAGSGGFDEISTTLANIRDYLIRILVYFGGIAFALTFILMMVALADERAQRGAKLAFKFSFIGLIGGVLVTSIVQIAIGFAPGGGGGGA